MASDVVWRVHVDVYRTDEVGHWLGTCKTRHVIRRARTENDARIEACNDAIALCVGADGLPGHHPGTYEDDCEALVSQCVPMPAGPKTVQA